MYEYRCRVVEIGDGDTLTVDLDFGFRLHQRMRVRLAGIDAPERGEEGWGEAKAFLAEILPVGSVVTANTEKPQEKYGRWLAWVTRADGLDVNQAMIDAGHATAY